MGNVTIEKFDEETFEFWHSDEVRPFLTVVADEFHIDEENERVEIFSRDYDHPVAIVFEYDFFKIV